MLYEKVPIYAKTCSSSWVFVLATKRNSVLGQLRGGEGRRRGIAPPSSIRAPRRISIPEDGTTSLRTPLRIRAAGKRASRGRSGIFGEAEMKVRVSPFPPDFHPSTRAGSHPLPRPLADPRPLLSKTEYRGHERRARTGLRPHPSHTPASVPHTSQRAQPHALQLHADLLANAGPAGLYPAPPR